MLEGQAVRAIQGITLSESNYQAAVEILHERFGKTQQIISADVDELLRLPTCTWDKPGQLRIIYDKIKINVRGLERLGVKAEQYGSFLIPVIMSRLPAEVRLHVARVSTKDVWEINELLKVIQAEVEAREMSDTMKIQEKKGTETTATPKRGFSLGTANSLLARSGNESGIRCSFCNGEHYSSACEEVKEIQKLLKLRKIESLVQVRNLLRTSQQHPQQEARCRYFCKQLENMLMLRIVPSYYLFVYYLIAEAKDLTLEII